MKESEFIALLNLYLDHEISAADAARLEAEVQSRPERRKIYQQYCRMQKACKVLAADFQTDEVAAGSTEKKVVAFNPVASASTRDRAGSFYTVGAFVAAAACVAIIFVGRNRQHAADAAQRNETVAATVPAVVNTPTTPRTSSGGIQRGSGTTLMSDSLLLTQNASAQPMFTGAVKEANEQLAWINNVQLTPLQQRLQADALHFDVPPTPLRPEARALRANRAPAEATVEMTAFQFVK